MQASQRCSKSSIRKHKRTIRKRQRQIEKARVERLGATNEKSSHLDSGDGGWNGWVGGGSGILCQNKIEDIIDEIWEQLHK